tara:strand:- start:412 stop:1620 length:1209 start_codon:yes stop_codon:yes gene_type:complete
LDLLNTSPVVFLNGPRQAGKSTLVQKISEKDFPAEYVTFDHTSQMAAAAHSPRTYLESRTRSLIIDEVQLVPEIFRELKVVVDELRRKSKERLTGRFLLTGSANVLALPKLSQPLVGRMAVQTLYPLSGTEVLDSSSQFLKNLFNQNFQNKPSSFKVTEIIKRATFPEISNSSLLERKIWFEGYLSTILQRDVKTIAEIDKLSSLPNLLRILAGRAGGLVNDADIARDVGLNPVTSRNYKTLLKMLFLTFELKPWYRNVSKRLIKSPKGFLVDTSLLCHLLQYDLETLELKRPELYGHVFENFIASELLKMTNNFHDPIELFHFRTSDHKEVDFVLQKPDGTLAGIEVKMRDHVKASDFKGLKTLQEMTHTDFKCGAVLYQGNEIIPFGPSLWALPVHLLWS